MSALIDSSVVIDVLRGVEQARRVVAEARLAGKLHGSVVVKAEVLAGMRPQELKPTQDILDSLEWHPVTEQMAERAGELGRTWRPSHGSIELADLIIAATAQLLGLPLLTRNIKHFPMFPDLQAPY
ncbi:MAG: type II toxin-antitoxin system VapC family toxin [Dehalococcoidia bacterium]